MNDKKIMKNEEKDFIKKNERVFEYTNMFTNGVLEYVICPTCYSIIDIEQDGYLNSVLSESSFSINIKDTKEDNSILCNNCKNYKVDFKDILREVDFNSYGLKEDLENEEDLLNPIAMRSFMLKRLTVYENVVNGEDSVCLSFTFVPTITRCDESSSPFYRGVRTDRLVSLNYTFRGKNITRSLKVFDKNKTYDFKLCGLGYTTDEYSQSVKLNFEAFVYIINTLGFDDDYKAYLIEYYNSIKGVNHHNAKDLLNKLFNIYKFKDLPLEYYILLGEFVKMPDYKGIKDAIRCEFNNITYKAEMERVYGGLNIMNLKRLISDEHNPPAYKTPLLVKDAKYSVNLLKRRLIDAKLKKIGRDLINENPISLDDKLKTLYYLFNFSKIDDLNPWEDYRELTDRELIEIMFKDDTKKRKNFFKSIVGEDKGLLKDVFKYPLAVVAYPIYRNIKNIDIRRNFMKDINNEIKGFAIKHQNLKTYEVFRKFFEEVDYYTTSNNITSILDVIRVDLVYDVEEPILESSVLTDRRIHGKVLKEFKDLFRKDLYHFINEMDAKPGLNEYNFHSYFINQTMIIEDSRRMVSDILEKRHFFEGDVEKYLNKNIKNMTLKEFHDFLSGIMFDISNLSDISYEYGISENIKDVEIDMNGEIVSIEVVRNTKALLNLGYEAGNCVVSYEDKILDNNSVILKASYKDILATIDISLDDERGPYLSQFLDKYNRSLTRDVPEDKIVIDAVYEYMKESQIAVLKSELAFSGFPFLEEIEFNKNSSYSKAFNKKHETIGMEKIGLND